jgi:DNA-binding transcriptional LysR family regulator
MRPLNIDLRKLQHTVALAEMRSFVRAAKHLNITQSALSRSIQSVEAATSVRLFDRDRTGVWPTAHGKLFLERARALLREAQGLDEMLHALAGIDIGIVRIGLGPALAGIAMPNLLTHMLNDRPDVRLSVLVQSPPALLSELVADRLDFIACSESLLDRTAPIVLRRIAMVSTWLVVRASHPLAERTAVSRADIAPYPLISGSFSEGYSSGFTDFGDLTLICDDYHALHHAALTSDAVWFTPPQVARASLADGRLKALPVTSPEVLDYPVAIARRRGRTLGSSAHHVERLVTSLVAGAFQGKPSEEPSEPPLEDRA